MLNDLLQEPNFVREVYGEPPEGMFATQTQGGTTVVTSINGISGPAVSIDGGTTGLSFSAAAPNISLAGTLVIANGGTGATTATGARTNLGIDVVATKKSNLAAAVAPAVTDDNTAGYAIGSVWIDTVLDDIYMATDVSTGAALWRKLN